MERYSCVNFSNSTDILRLYNNLKHDQSLLLEIPNIEIDSRNISIVCLEIIESRILEELNETFYDREMEEILLSSGIGLSNINKTNNDSSNINKTKNDLSNINETKNDPSNINEKNNDPSNINEKKNDLLYCKNLNILLKPHFGISNREIVNMVYFVFKKTGISHFDFLFELFSGRDICNALEIRVQLCLLFAKGLKLRSFDFTEFKEYFDREESEEKVKSVDQDSLDSQDDDDSDGIFRKNPFLEYSHQETDQKITTFGFNEALEFVKKFMLTYNDPGFIVWNAPTYLSLKFDRKIFTTFLKCKNEDSFMRKLMQIPNVPFFFYENVCMMDLLEALPEKTSRLDSIYNCSIDEIPNIKMPVNCMTLRGYLIGFGVTILNTRKIEFPDFSRIKRSYPFFARGLKYFVEEYDSIALFKLFKETMECDFDLIKGEVKNILLNDLMVFIRAFYKPVDSEDVVFSFKIEEDAFRIPLVDFPSRNRPYPCFWDSNSEELANFYFNGEIYKEQDKRLATMMLMEFYELFKFTKEEVKEYMEDLLLTLSKNSYHKIYILENISEISEIIRGIYKDFQPENIEILNKILQNIKKIPETNWRYKKALIKNINELEKVGIEKEWVKNALKDDKVFYIRKLAEAL